MPSVARPLVHGTRAAYLRGCHCKRCQRANAVYQSELRARRRGLTPVPALPLAEPLADDSTECQPRRADDFDEAGPCVRAVRASIDRLGVRESEPALCAAAEAMAAILDDRLLATTQPSAAGKLLTIMVALRKAAEPRHGRLAAVEAMGSRVRVKTARPGAD